MVAEPAVIVLSTCKQKSQSHNLGPMRESQSCSFGMPALVIGVLNLWQCCSPGWNPSMCRLSYSMDDLDVFVDMVEPQNHELN